MSTEKDDINNLGNRYGQLYAENNTFFNEMSRSYSSGIDAPTVSPNLLRVYSRNNMHYQGSLRVRSSPSSPNRLSKLQYMTKMHKKWPALTKVNISSTSGLELLNSHNSKSLHNSNKSCDFSFTDQLDLPNSHLVAVSGSLNNSNSWNNLQLKNELQLSQVNNKVFKEKVLTHEDEQKPGTMEDENSKNSVLFPKDTDYNEQKLSFPLNKSVSNPINFKKALRDRYLNSQKSATNSLFNKFAPNLFTQSLNCNQFRSVFKSDSLLSESRDHNFHLNQSSDLEPKPDHNEPYQNKLSPDSCRTRNALSLNILNLTMPRKYKLRSNNSAVSPVSGIEPDCDPFSPSSFGICSPLLKLNLPYRSGTNKDNESLSQSLIPSSSLSELSSATEADDLFTKSQDMVSTQRFFPENMKISDCNLTKLSKFDIHFDHHIPNHLGLPELNMNRPTCKSAPQSFQNNAKSQNIMSSSLSSNYTDAIFTSYDSNCLRPISNSRSMDHISSYMNEKKEDGVSKSFDVDISKHFKLDRPIQNKSFLKLNSIGSVHQKSKSISNTSISTKKLSITSANVNQRQCNVCGRQFNRSDMLARHIRVHTGHKPFECSICGQSFSRSDHLNTHLRIHSGEKPYRCSICSYSACRRDMITRHLRVHKKKGDILSDSNSSLVLNINKQKSIHQKRNSKVKSQNSLSLDPESYGDMKESISSLYRSQSFTDTDQRHYNQHKNSLASESPNETPITPRTFANISISISHPTPRSSFSIPMDTQNY